MGKTAQRIEIIHGDLTDESVEAIVNAANTDLILGAGVAGAIRRRGGPAIQEQCEALSPIPLGGAVVTRAGELPARFIIHAAVMSFQALPTSQTIRDATWHSLKIAAEQKFETISFPALGTGVGGFAMDQAARVMITTVKEFFGQYDKPRTVRFVLFDDHAARIFRSILKNDM